MLIKSGTGAATQDDEELVLIQINKTQLNKHTTESTWAKSLGADLYQIKGPLHLITGVNSQDIVKAVILPGDARPSLSKVVRRSGFRTLRLVFLKTVLLKDRKKLLEELLQWNATFVTPFDRFYTVEISPDGNYPAVCSYLKSLSVQKLIVHEPEVSLEALLRFRFLR